MPTGIHLKRMLLLHLATVALAHVPAFASETDTLTVVTLNIWHDAQDWPRRRTLILDEMRSLRPDIICLQEVLQHQTLRNQAFDLADSLGYKATFSSVDPDTSTKRYGNAILTRHSMIETNWKPLDPKNDYRTVAHMRLSFRGRPIDVFCTHLHHTDEGAAIRAEQIADLLTYVKRQSRKNAIVLAGDFNALPSAPELKSVTKQFRDVFAELHADQDSVTTLNPAKGLPRRRIDYIFVPRGGQPRLDPFSTEIVFDTPASDGAWPSDHFGVAAKLLIRK